MVEAWQRFKEIVLVTDGDTTPLKAVADRVKVIVRRCLFHIPLPIQGREFITLPKSWDYSP